MAYSEDLARQVDAILAEKKVEYEVKKMMRGSAIWWTRRCA